MIEKRKEKRAEIKGDAVVQGVVTEGVHVVVIEKGQVVVTEGGDGAQVGIVEGCKGVRAGTETGKVLYYCFIITVSTSLLIILEVSWGRASLMQVVEFKGS